MPKNKNKSSTSFIVYLTGFIASALFLIAFISVPLLQEKPSTASFSSVYTKTIKNADMENYPEKNKLQIEEYFQISPDLFEEVQFDRTDDALNANELLLVKFDNDAAALKFEEAVNSRIDAQKNTYESYAPEAYDLVKDAQVRIHKNYALYVVGSEAKKIADQFEEAL